MRKNKKVTELRELSLIEEKIISILGKNHTTTLQFTPVSDHRDVYGLYTYRGCVYVLKNSMDIDFESLTEKDQIKIFSMVEKKQWVLNKSLQ